MSALVVARFGRAAASASAFKGPGPEAVNTYTSDSAGSPLGPVIGERCDRAAATRVQPLQLKQAPSDAKAGPNLPRKCGKTEERCGGEPRCALTATHVFEQSFPDSLKRSLRNAHVELPGRAENQFAGVRFELVLQTGPRYG